MKTALLHSCFSACSRRASLAQLVAAGRGSNEASNSSCDAGSEPQVVWQELSLGVVHF